MNEYDAGEKIDFDNPKMDSVDKDPNNPESKNLANLDSLDSV